MKKTLLLIIAALTMVLGATAQNKQAKAPAKAASKTLVVYFSVGGRTAGVAQELATALKADIAAIEPQVAYTDADIDWHNQQSRSSVEMKNEKARPAIKPLKKNVANYSTVYLGYPIWWGVSPRIINTFIESSKLQGKTIRLFATSGSSTIDKSVQTLKTTYPKLKIQDARLLNGGKTDVQAWLKK